MVIATIRIRPGFPLFAIHKLKLKLAFNGAAAEPRIDLAVGERSETHGIMHDPEGGREKDSTENGTYSSPQHSMRRSHCVCCIYRIATSNAFEPSIRSTSRSPRKTALYLADAERIPGVPIRSPQAPCAHPWLYQSAASRLRLRSEFVSGLAAELRGYASDRNSSWV